MDNMDFKKIWQEGRHQEGKVSQEALERLIASKSQSLLDKLKKTVKIENWVNISTTVIVAMYFIWMKEWLLTIVMTISLTIVSFYYYRLYQKILNFQYTDNVLEYLRNLNTTLNLFIKRYLWSLGIIIILSYLFGIYIADPEFIYQELSTMKILAILISLVGTLAIFGFVLYLYIYNMYGKKNKKVKEMIRSLTNNRSAS